MANYNLQVNWSGKDALSDSDPDKIISGDDLNTEFNAVKTAVNTKADSTGDASQAFAASTAAAGTNTTQVATTAFVHASFAPLASPALTGVPTVPTAAEGTNTTQAASTAFVITETAYATQTNKGTVRAYLSGSDLYIYTQD